MQPVGDIDEQVRLIVENTQGELLAEALTLAQSLRVKLDEELLRELLEDESQPISLREYSLRDLNDANAIEYGLVHNAWQLRAAARDLLLEQDLERATSLLLEAVETGDIFEAQAAVTTLATVPSLFAKIDAATLRREVKLEYAQGDSLEVENDWIVWGGKPNLGKQVVYNNPLGQCMRCHKIG